MLAFVRLNFVFQQLLVGLLAVLTSHGLLSCHGYPTHVPITVCEYLMPGHQLQPLQFALPQPMNTNPYSIHVSNTSYTPGGTMTVVINGTMGIKVNEYGSSDLWILLLTSSYL